MAIDERLATRVRTLLSTSPGFTERKMFGGICFLVHGHMTAGVVGETLMLRVGPEQYRAALAKPHAREMDFTGRPLTGMIYVDPPGYQTREALARWLDRALTYVHSQPPKTRKPKARRPAG